MPHCVLFVSVFCSQARTRPHELLQKDCLKGELALSEAFVLLPVMNAWLRCAQASRVSLRLMLRMKGVLCGGDQSSIFPIQSKYSFWSDLRC